MFQGNNAQILDAKKRELREKLDKLNNMQVCRSLIEILEAGDKEQLKAEYKRFRMRPLVGVIKPSDDHLDYGRVGKIDSIDDTQFLVDNGKYYLIIYYKAFELADGANFAEYEQLRNECNQLGREIYKLEFRGFPLA